MVQGGNSLHFWYDAQNKPTIVEWNNGSTTAKYAYILNLQGDVVGLRDATGNEVVRYTYDAWGKLLETSGSLAATLSYLNPFRYRGYVYDEETGLYYLRSRYYNPVRCLFVNADEVSCYFIYNRVDNCYAYCNCCPTMYTDEDGFVSQNFDLGKEWYWRIDPPNAGDGMQRHIHVWKRGRTRILSKCRWNTA